MADLDDFFAKKDRKKTKTKKFSTTAEELARQDNTSKKPGPPPRKQESVAPVVGVDGEILPQEEQVRKPPKCIPVTVILGVMYGMCGEIDY